VDAKNAVRVNKIGGGDIGSTHHINPGTLTTGARAVLDGLKFGDALGNYDRPGTRDAEHFSMITRLPD